MSESKPVGSQILHSSVARSLEFLRAAATNPAIRAILASKGYTPEEHQTGWRLLHRAAGYEVVSTHDPLQADVDARNAIAALDQWDEPNFRVIEAALARLFPVQRDFVFANLTPATGAGAVLSVQCLLDRLDALEHSPERASTRTQDHAALALLAQRGITGEERLRLRALVAAAKNADLPLPSEPAPTGTTPAQHEQHLIELYAWYKDWSQTAHAFIKRRDHLILLGLAKRKPRTPKASTPAGSSSGDGGSACGPKP